MISKYVMHLRPDHILAHMMEVDLYPLSVVAFILWAFVAHLYRSYRDPTPPKGGLGPPRGDDSPTTTTAPLPIFREDDHNP